MRLLGYSIIGSAVLVGLFAAGSQAFQSSSPDMPIAKAALTEAKKPMPVGAKPTVLVELFTSQGCSSCPPADALAAKLASDPNVLVVTRAVTYWDRLGWKDTLGNPVNDQLQRAYAQKGNAAAGVYTPQIVVNGGDGAVGSRESDVRGLLKTAFMKEMADPAKLTVSTGADGGKTVMLSGTTDGTAKVTLLALASDRMVRIGAGENGGRAVHYINVLVSVTALGNWSGGAQAIEVPAAMLKNAGADRYAITVQYPDAGPVLAAAKL